MSVDLFSVNTVNARGLLKSSRAASSSRQPRNVTRAPRHLGIDEPSEPSAATGFPAASVTETRLWQTDAPPSRIDVSIFSLQLDWVEAFPWSLAQAQNVALMVNLLFFSLDLDWISRVRPSKKAQQQAGRRLDGGKLLDRREWMSQRILPR